MSELLPATSNVSSQVCKKCNKVIFEGHAYELGEDRWHINCFKCFKCEKSLGCNSNFLVLGNGSLVCSNCSYSCKQCGKKIDDLAILTGDQAYCSNCFKCRVCKSKIEDLRYARTSKGLFCMSCHEELIAKKKKHDLKRKQMASLSSSSRPSPSEEVPNPLLETTASPLNSVAGDIYSQRSPSSSSLLHKQLPPNPGSGVNGSGNALTSPPSTRGSGGPGVASEPGSYFVPAAASSTSTFESASNQAHGSGQAPQLSKLPSQTSAYSGSQNLTGSEKTQSSGPSSTPADSQNIHSSDIEEVNDSDDELNLRKMHKKLERRFKNSTEPDGAILELIDSFSAPNTPSTIYNDPELIASSLSQQDIPNLTKHDATSIPSPEVSTRSRVFDPRRAEHPSPHKNIFLLSPNQFHDREFHNTQGMHNNSLGSSFTGEDIQRSRSAASSPMAKVNRQARVVETNDEVSASEIPIDTRAADDKHNDLYSTPKKSSISLQQPISSPPPRMALPEVPSTPRTDKSETVQRFDFGEPRGLGFEGVDMQKPSRSMKPATPAVTNLENISSGDADQADSHRTPPSRKQSVRSKMSIRHKRSISNGSNSLTNKFGIFKGKDESPATKGHSRHVSEGSANGQAYTTPPLPLSSPMSHGFSRDPHARSTSDTQFLSSMENDITNKDFEMRTIKFEIYQLDNRRQNLLVENMKLSSERNKLLETINLLQKKVATETEAQEMLTHEVESLSSQRSQLIEENQRLKAENDSLKETSSTKSRELNRPDSNNQRTSQIFDTFGELYESNNVSDTLVDDSADTQRATRLKFWRRPKVTITNTQPQSSQGSGQVQGSIPQSTNSHKLGQAFSSNQLSNQSQTTEDSSGARKALNTFISKSRSTTILDSFVNGVNNGSTGSQQNDAPLLTTSIQRRAIYENEKVPLIITKCLEEVEKRGLDMEGIYRLSGGNSAIVAIENAFSAVPANGTHDRKHMQKINEALSGDINAVTSAFKRYLRKLPEPLIPYSVYDSFIKIGHRKGSDRELCNEFTLRVLNRLPPANKHAMYLICKHLDQVNRNSSVNRMNFKNLSVVFAPTLARDPSGEREMVDMGHRNEATELLFSNFSVIFAEYARSL